MILCPIPEEQQALIRILFQQGFEKGNRRTRLISTFLLPLLPYCILDSRSGSYSKTIQHAPSNHSSSDGSETRLWRDSRHKTAAERLASTSPHQSSIHLEKDLTQSHRCHSIQEIADLRATWNLGNPKQNFGHCLCPADSASAADVLETIHIA